MNQAPSRCCDYVHRPASARVLVHEPRTALPDRGSELTIWTHGPWLGIEQVTCGSCRRVMGVAFLGVPAWLDDDQRLTLQRRLAYASQPDAAAEKEVPGAPFEGLQRGPLRSAREWEGALTGTAHTGPSDSKQESPLHR